MLSVDRDLFEEDLEKPTSVLTDRQCNGRHIHQSSLVDIRPRATRLLFLVMRSRWATATSVLEGALNCLIERRQCDRYVLANPVVCDHDRIF